jgi:hypothetical protein
MATASALFVIVVGTLLAVGLAWLLLSGILRVTFHRARSALRRIAERRRAARKEADRRAGERRT